ncbi:MAG: hypothetical protein AVDCRST_MAG85-1407, partial [uncultured Solirubrobacteraceae bacterium]
GGRRRRLRPGGGARDARPSARSSLGSRSRDHPDAVRGGHDPGADRRGRGRLADAGLAADPPGHRAHARRSPRAPPQL